MDPDGASTTSNDPTAGMRDRAMHLFLSTGEPSGDLHAANLARELKRLDPSLKLSGFGGPRLAEAGCEVIYPLTELAVMWFTRVLLNLGTFLGILRQAERFFEEHRPDLVVLIDYPGLHWWIARAAHQRGIPVVYFVPPQIWAWAPWRIEKIKRHFDELLCSLPFEPRWYHQRGYPHATYIGHPYFDELRQRRLDPAVLERYRSEADDADTLAILPGSRSAEVGFNGPPLLKAAAKLAAVRPRTRFRVAAYKSTHAQTLRDMLDALDLPTDQRALLDRRLSIHVGETPEILRVAAASWSVSGSVSLELMMEAVPSAVVYLRPRWNLWVARRFIQVRYISLVNLIADEEIFPEFLESRDITDDLVRLAQGWLDDPAQRARALAGLDRVRDLCAQPGATRRAAERLLTRLHGPEQMARLLQDEAGLSQPASLAPSATRFDPAHSVPCRLEPSTTHSGIIASKVS